MGLHPIVLDTDPGVDDALAIIYALNHLDLQVHAITTVCGNIGVDQATINTQIVLSLLDCVVPLAMGQNQPIYYPLQTAPHVHGLDGLGNVSVQFESLEEQVVKKSAVELILDFVAKFPDQLRLVCIGPLTNIAQAILANSPLMRRTKEIILMGGAFEQRGNVTTSAEFNIYVDPHAAKIVLESGVPITILSLDLTHQVILSADRLHQATLCSNAPWRDFTWSITQPCMRFHQHQEGFHGMYLHDPLAVGYLLRPDLFKTVPAEVRVETSSSSTRGMTVANLHQQPMTPNAQICVAVKVEQFLNHFLQTLLDLP
ncbi:MAG: nucleoside hydrolase [Candidatus Poribacteria bacterium]|jgi:inosine-uridine nucleoside N-ribohydrolase|nr:nucleoside hydrolase [Candidatus Poribacteria bacterium]MDP6748481.1 nucleoside hydrolase [Candidatus Poribacteria bacterium]MDP6995063.1 nucleoside hydrolase [Candidatus Poribacteria bacterium]